MKSFNPINYLLNYVDSNTRFWDLIPDRGWEISLRHRVQSESGAHPASYSIGTGCSFPEVKQPGRAANHSPTASECVELYIHSLTM
jgi:hypothetical protein